MCDNVAPSNFGANPILEDQLKVELSDCSPFITAPGVLSKCGEIFVAKQGGLFLCCIFCNQNFTSLQIFGTHLLQKHPLVDFELRIAVRSELTKKSANKHNKTGTNDALRNKRHRDDIKIYKKQEINSSDDYNNDENSKNDFSSERSDEEYSNFAIDSDRKTDDSDVVPEDSPKVKRKHSDSSTSDYKVPMRDSKDESLESNEIYDKPKKLRLRERKIVEGHWKCIFCGHVCKKGVERVEHLKGHDGVKRLICETCGKGYNDNYQLALHIKNHTGERPYKCQFCPSTFKCNQTLKQHERTHFDYKPFKCNFCEATFKSKTTKLKHEIRHTASEEKQFECDLCNKKFLTKLKMTEHRGRHKFEGKPYQCQKCPKSFQTKYNLNAHERLEHRGEYNYKCEFCEKVFIKKSQKKAHELSHTRVGQPFPCDLCEKKYATREGLYKHKKRDHIPNLPPPEYKCAKCGERFENPSLYAEHCRRHNLEENQFVCKDCGARFDSHVKLTTHYIRLHNYNDPPVNLSS